MALTLAWACNLVTNPAEQANGALLPFPINYKNSPRYPNLMQFKSNQKWIYPHLQEKLKCRDLWCCKTYTGCKPLTFSPKNLQFRLLKFTYLKTFSYKRRKQTSFNRANSTYWTSFPKNLAENLRFYNLFTLVNLRHRMNMIIIIRRILFIF